jgi:hypothetical protein
VAEIIIDSPGIDQPHDRRDWVPRATRLKVEAPVVYRAVSDESWAVGATLDISRSGVLFVPSEDIPDPELNLVIFLSRTSLEAAGVPLPDLYCGGPVIRAVDGPDGRRALAIRFEHDSAEYPANEFWQSTPQEDLPPN